MVELNINAKTGFKITDPNKPVVIRDFRGLFFYSTEGLAPNVEEFNLPGFGKYFVDSGHFKQLPEPVRFKRLALPAIAENKFFPDPTQFKIEFGDNPYKCTVSYVKGIIKFDNAFRDASLPQIYFLLYHEYGHQFFKTEKYADFMSANYMMVKGFNPSQIVTAPWTTLSDKQEFRKQLLVRRIIEVNNGLKA